MPISVGDFARLVGSNTISGVFQRLGIHWPPPPPISVREVIQQYGLPAAPTNLRISWQEGGTFIDHPPNSTNVPLESGDVLLNWNDSGRGSQRAVTYYLAHFQFKGRAMDFNVTAPVELHALLGSNFDFNTPYLWQITPVNEFGRGLGSPAFTFTTEPHRAPPPPPPPPPIPPVISVSSSGTGQSSVFTVVGSGFSPNHDVRIRVVDDAGNATDFHQSSDSEGKLNARLGIPCNVGFGLHFSATDGRSNPNDLTGLLWSNTFNTSCP